ncbi:MAG: hypothetical protein R2771_04975 [Saprospiraceae bacterium]
MSHEGTYSVTSNPNNVHTNFVNMYDHTEGNSSGLMMVVNGDTHPNTIVWQQDISVTPNKWYDFSAWGAYSC